MLHICTLSFNDSLAPQVTPQNALFSDKHNSAPFLDRINCKNRPSAQFTLASESAIRISIMKTLTHFFFLKRMQSFLVSSAPTQPFSVCSCCTHASHTKCKSFRALQEARVLIIHSGEELRECFLSGVTKKASKEMTILQITFVGDSVLGQFCTNLPRTDLLSSHSIDRRGIYRKAGSKKFSFDQNSQAALKRHPEANIELR